MTKPDKIDYAQLNEELQTIINQLQAGDTDIDEAVKLYERGSKLIKQLQNHLATAENTVRRLQAEFAE